MKTRGRVLWAGSVPAARLRRCWFVAALLCFAAEVSALEITRVRCEYADNPLGIDLVQPRLFWELHSERRGDGQTAYQVLVASSPEVLERDEGDLWDSRRVASDATTHIVYDGKALASSQQVFWKVRSWDAAGQPSPWSAVGTWTMGVLKPEEWKARWIAAPWASEGLLLRQEFAVSKPVKRAVLHLCGLGQYEFFLNGKKGSDDLLSPGWTNYNETTLYNTYDVTAQLRTGPNALGVALGNGMYHVVRRNRFAKFTGSFGPLRLIAQLEIEYKDGSRQLLATDDSWRVHRGGITYNSIYGGEDFDARLEPADWKSAGFDVSSWTRAVYIIRPSPTLYGHSRAAEPIRAIESREPVEVRPLGPGVAVYDFGQNASFMPRLRVTGPAGSTVRLTPGEVLNPDGTIDRGTMGGAHRGSAWWQYTKATDGEESWFPQFYYVGSRYLYTELIPASEGGERPAVAHLEAVVVHSTAEPVGNFSTSNPLLNRIHQLVRWAQRSNMVSVLTDCPHREKLGWIEQYHLNGPSIRYEFDVARIFTKGMQDMATAQTAEGLVPNITPEFTEFKGAFRAAAEWGAAFILVPWQQYQFTGDTRLLREHYPAMKRYFAYLESRTKDGLLADGLGDWYDFVLEKSGQAKLTPSPITATAFLYYDAKILGEIAAVLGEQAEAEQFRTRAAEIRSRYNREFFKPETPTYGTDSQASIALPLVLGLAEPQYRKALLERLVRDVEQRGYATAGDIGFRFLLLALAEGGRSDSVYRLINQDEKPGYGYQLKQGATALTESWNAGRGASHNHFMLGQVIEWYYEWLAGLRPETPGFKTFHVAPEPIEDLTWVQAKYRSIHGPIGVRWEKTATQFSLSVEVPANTRALVRIPAKAQTSVLEGGQAVSAVPGIEFVAFENGRVTYRVGSGKYRFTSEL